MPLICCSRALKQASVQNSRASKTAKRTCAALRIQRQNQCLQPLQVARSSRSSDACRKAYSPEKVSQKSAWLRIRLQPVARSVHCEARAMLLSCDALCRPELPRLASDDSSPYHVASARLETANVDITQMSCVRLQTFGRFAVLKRYA